MTTVPHLRVVVAFCLLAQDAKQAADDVAGAAHERAAQIAGEGV